jgi:haloacetate dehalogenase
MDSVKAKGHWFFIFNSTPDLPEALITGREETWLRYILQGWTYDPELFRPDEMAADLRIGCPTLVLLKFLARRGPSGGT